jgi:class 3 adenylate cyclase
MDIKSLIAIATGVLTLLGAVVAITRYTTRLQCQIEQSGLQDELKRIQQRYADLEVTYRDMLRSGADAVTKKSAIETELMTIIAAVRATSGSIIIPTPSLGEETEPTELVFLSLIGSAAPILKGTRVPMASVAGSVFSSGKPRITHDPKRDSSFSARVDAVAPHSTDELLALPLLYSNKVIGVAEFLNKEGNARFDDNDQFLAERLCASLAARVTEFARNGENFQLLGVTVKSEAEEATILCSDLSHWSALTRQMDVAAVIDLTNEYFEKMCDVCLRNEATIDQFLGDGFFVSFNVPRRLALHQSRAVATAVEMQRVFEDLKKKWMAFQLPGTNSLYNRIGISCGKVHKAEVGHSQYRHITLIGDPVNEATHLCDIGDRGRNVIVIGKELHDTLQSGFTVRELSSERLKAIRGKVDRAYELVLA